MFSKKDKNKYHHKKFMKLALSLARNSNGFTGENPSVGCVITKNNKIISYASTGINGVPHAEAIALKKINKNTKGSNVYVSLEPCSHFGKTPPCTSALISSKIKNVFYASTDYDERTRNRAQIILKKRKINTFPGLLKKEGDKFYEKHNFSKLKKIPYVIGKLACSKNFKIFNNKNYITNKYSRKLSHLLRYQNKGILTSHKTVNSDNPKLNCRINGLIKFSPHIFIIDKNLMIKKRSTIINQNQAKVYIFHSCKDKKKINFFKSKKIKLIYLNKYSNNKKNLLLILSIIYRNKINTLLLESGPNLLNSFLISNLINEFYLFRSNNDIKPDSSTVLSIKSLLNNIKLSFKFKKKINTNLDKDELIHYY